MLDWAEVRSIACLEWVCKGVLHGSPWENRLTFKLWNPGHNTDFQKGYICALLRRLVYGVFDLSPHRVFLLIAKRLKRLIDLLVA